MSHCWTCGNATAALQYECVQCKQLDVMSHIDQGVGQLGQSETLQSTIGAFQLQALNELKDKVERGIVRVERGLSRVVSAIHWSTERLQWSLQEQTSVLQGIDQTLRTPSQTQGNEWRKIADELSSRGVRDDATEYYRKSLSANPLDFRTYIGLGRILIEQDDFGEAFTILEKSLPHAPCSEHQSKGIIDYRSYVFRLQGHIAYCDDDVEKARDLLTSAINLSPNYGDALYEHAQYSAVLNDTTGCRDSLIRAIKVKPYYWASSMQDGLLLNCKPVVRGVLVGMRDKLREELVAEEDKFRDDAKNAIDTQEPLNKRREFLRDSGVESKTISEIMSPAESDAKRSALHYIRLVELCETTRTVEGYPRLIEQESQYRTAVEESKGWRSPQQVIADCDRRVINHLQADRSGKTKIINELMLSFCGILLIVGVTLLIVGSYFPAIAVFVIALIGGFVIRAEIIGQRPHVKHAKTYQTLFLPPQNVS